MTDRTTRIAYLDAQIQRHALYAQYHIATAQTGASKLRKVFQGDHELSDVEKANDNLQAAERHLQNMGQCMDMRDDLIRQEYGLKDN